MTSDGVVDLDDFQFFAYALIDPDGWCSLTGWSVEQLLNITDFTGDGRLDVADVPLFGEALRATLADGGGNESGLAAARAESGRGMRSLGAGYPQGGYVDLDVDSDNDDGADNPERDSCPDPNKPCEEQLCEDELEYCRDALPKFIPLDQDPNDPIDLIPLMLQIVPDPNTFAPGDVVHYIIDIDYDDPYIRVWPTRSVGTWPDDAVQPRHLQQCVQLADAYEYALWFMGDGDCDGDVDFFDIDALLVALQGEAAYQQHYPNCHWLTCDLDLDDDVDFFDTDRFMDRVGQPPEVRPRRLWMQALQHSAREDIIAYANLGTDPNCVGYSDKDYYDEVHVYTGDCCDPNDAYSGSYGVPPGYGERCDDPEFESRCWFYNRNWHYDSLGQPVGFPLQMELVQGFGPGDLPPRKLDPQLSSSPLVSKASAHFQGLDPHVERSMLADKVDLVTGVPLLQETDFELPFGGAVFRHVRTYSENFTDHLWRNLGLGLTSMSGSQGSTDCPASTFWDWNGRFWMMSENPILLIDAAYTNIADPNVRICYFIPDAHHTIPFVDDNGDGSYVAPPWFDATLHHDGTKVNGQWTVQPTSFWIWTHRSTIRYTFEPHFEDTWDFYNQDAGCYANAHDHPEDPNCPGWGVPYYGLVTEIRDCYENTVEYVYCEFNQYYCGDTFDDFDTYTDCCDRCCQNCNAKGQIKAIRLRSGPEQDIIWTLLYTHRTFGWLYDDGEELFLPSRDHMLHRKLHSIHVYEGAVDIPSDETLTLSWEDNFLGLSSFEDYLAVEPSVPAGWVQRTKYVYVEPDTWQYWDIDPNSLAPEGSPYALFGETIPVGLLQFKGLNVGYALLQTSTTRRGSHTEEELTEDRVYRYELGDNTSATVNWVQSNGALTLGAVYTPATVKSALEHWQQKYGEAAHPSVLYYEAWDCPVRDDDPNTPDIDETADIESLADYCFHAHTNNGYIFDYGKAEDFVEATAEFLSPPLDRIAMVQTGVDLLVDRTSSKDEPRAYSVFRLHAYHHDIGADTWASEPHLVGPGDHVPIYHWPYREPNEPHWGLNLEYVSYVDTDFTQPWHITLIDEIDPEELDDYDPETAAGVIARRVVEMNPAGFVLSDRTWEYTDEGMGLVAVEGFAEKRFYDDLGRLVALGSKGWSSETNPDPNSAGLVHVFSYYAPDPNDEDDRGEVEAIGIRPGVALDGGQLILATLYDGVRWVKQYIREPNRTELVAAEVDYPCPQTQLNPNLGDVTTYDYTFKSAAEKAPIIAKTVTRPATLRNGTEQGAVEALEYDSKGNLEWRRIGSDDPNGESFVEYNEYNDKGQRIRNIFDVAPAEPNVPSLPSGWARNSETAPLNLTTLWEYDDIFGLHKVVHPNGRETHIVYEFDPNDGYGLYVWTYENVVPNGSTCELKSPIKLIHTKLGQVVFVREISIGTVAYPPAGGESYTSEQILSESRPTYNVGGQVDGVERSSGGDTLAAYLSYHSSGLVSREEGPDGTIRRYVYDELGRLLYVLQGTRDTHVVWGTADPEDPNSFDDDMLLLEKRYYGVGVTDADELVTVRRYDEKPANQYREQDPNGDWAGGIVPNEDDIGWITEYYYDWRMRPAWVTQNDPNGNAVRHTLTWYDNLDREVIVAEYGPDCDPGALDPNSLGADWSPDPNSAAALFATSAPPHSVTENILNARGQPEEVRHWTWNDADSDYQVDEGEVNYTTTITYYDHADRPVEVHAADGPIRKYVYDAKGRQVFSRAFVGATLVTETETVYDANDRATQIIHSERAPDGTFINTYTHNWYDEAGRVWATADYGTNNAEFSAENQTDPNYLPTPPDPNTPGVLVTTYEYDEAGRQSAVHHPDGFVTRYRYDGFGRLLMTIDNADKMAPYHRRITANLYDDRGRLEAMAAIDPAHFGYDPNFLYDTIDWNDPNDATIQVTRFTYDAIVYPAGWDMGVPSGGWDPNWAASSASNTWISRVDYPDGMFLEFDYYSDGSVARRVDSRGVGFFHSYDTLGRRINTWIDDWAFYSPSSALDPLYRIHHINYQYNSRGDLEDVQTTSWAGGTPEVVSQNVYGYDGYGNLSYESQMHGALPERTVAYGWDVQPFTGIGSPQFTHLGTIQYPSGGPSLIVNYGDDTSDLDAVLGNVTKISDLSTTLAEFGYCGTARRVLSTRGDDLVVQSFGSGHDLDGLDAFGRIIDLDYTDGSQTIHRYQYGYDKSGNRTYARVTQTPLGGVPHDNDRSYSFYHDPLDRLEWANLGRLAPDNGSIIADPNVPLAREWLWTFDAFDNWAGRRHPALDPAGLGVLDDTDGDGTYDDGSLRITHEVTSGNEIETAWINDGTLVTQSYVYDAAGNLVFDGEFLYQYDGFNRLVQVNAGTDLDVNDFAATGRLVDPNTAPVGVQLATFVYDGLGRLIRTVRQDPNAAEAEDYYYDGVRRIQEVVTDPGDPNTPLVTRNYVWGPGYVDEILARRDDVPGQPARLYFLLQDANYNTVALLDAGGAVLAQWQYEPYGQVVAYDADPNAPVTRLGFQGLFFERFYYRTGEALGANPGEPPSVPPLSDSARGLYHVRNRWLDPLHGRFTSRDPVDTTLPVLTALASNGQAIAIVADAFDAQGHFGDGMNLYAAYGGDPIGQLDASGLFSLADLLGGASLRGDLMASEGDAGATLLEGVRGLVGFLNYRNVLLSDLTDTMATMAGTAGIDAVLMGYDAYQRMMVARLGASALRSGIRLARAGFGALARAGSRLFRSGGQSFESWSAMRRFLGSAGPNHDWHHVVEQCQIDGKRITSKQVNNTKNVIALPTHVHRRVSGYYSSKKPFTDGLRVRDWLRNKSFREQHEFGLRVIRENGG